MLADFFKRNCFCGVPMTTFIFCMVMLTISGVTYGQDSLSIEQATVDLSDEVVITAQYEPTHVKNSIYKVKIIQAEQIQSRGFLNLAEVLANQVNLRVNFDPVLGNSIKIQGIGGENVLVMVDGVPVIGRLDGHIDLSQLMTGNVERIEVIEGALSSQYGSNASGGVINIVTKKRQKSSLSVESQNLVESVGIFSNSLGIGGKYKSISGHFNAIRNQYQFEKIDSFRLLEKVLLDDGSTYTKKKYPWYPKTQFGWHGDIRFAPSDSFSVTYQYNRFSEDINIYGDIKRPQFKPYAFDETYSTLREDHQFGLEWYPASWLFINSVTAYNEFNRTKYYMRRDMETDTVEYLPAEQDTTGFTAFLHRSVFSSIFKSPINYQIGVEYLDEVGTGKRIIDSLSEINNGSRIYNLAGWFGVSYRPTQNFRISVNSRFGYNTQFKHPLTPSINLLWRPWTDYTFRAGYARGFRSPSVKELYLYFVDVNHHITGNPDLSSEVSDNYYLNGDYSWQINAANKLDIGGKLFYNKINDRIVLAITSGLMYTYRNIESFETYGANLVLGYRYKKWITLNSAFGFNQISDQNSVEVTGSRFVPVYELRNDLILKIPYALCDLNINHNYFPKQLQYYIGSDEQVNEGFFAAYQMVNASLGKSFFSQSLFVTAGVKNLFNIRDIQVVGSSNEAHQSNTGSQVLGWGRSWFAGVNVNLGIIK